MLGTLIYEIPSQMGKHDDWAGHSVVTFADCGVDVNRTANVLRDDTLDRESHHAVLVTSVTC